MVYIYKEPLLFEWIVPKVADGEYILRIIYMYISTYSHEGHDLTYAPLRYRLLQPNRQDHVRVN